MPTTTPGSRPRRALVLSGGGAKGSFQIGVLEVLILERGLDFDVFCGVSVGSLNAAFLAQATAASVTQAQSLTNLQAAFRDLRSLWLDGIAGNSSVYTKRVAGLPGIVVGADSLFDSAPLRRLIAQSVDAARLRVSGRDLRIQYVSLESGDIATVDQTDPRILDHVLASSSMPFLFPPVEVGGEHLVDGGLRDITPLSQAFKADPPPDEIYVVFASPFALAREGLKDDWLGTAVNGLTILGRTIEILTSEIYRNDVDGARRLNAVKAGWEAARATVTDPAARQALDDALAGIRVARLLEIAPQRSVIDDALDFDPALLRRNYEHGKETARALLPEA